MESKFNLPTETVELPSKGLLYPKNHPLSSGKVEMKYMTAKEEDILSNVNYIRKGTAIDRVLKSLLVTKVPFDEILIGDKNAIMIAARILSYGKDYKFEYRGEEHTVDLSELKEKEVDYKLFENGKNEFEFKLPNTDNTVTFKVLSQKDESSIDREVAGRQKIDKQGDTSGTTRLKHIITSVNGESDPKDIRDFVDNYMLASDARALRNYYAEISPDVNLTFTFENADGGEEEAAIPVGVTFFWPDFQLP